MSVSGGRAVVPSGDYVARAMRFVGDLDPKVSWVLDRVLEPGDTALDIGANLGLISLRMAGRVGPAGCVHAFEPQPRLVGYLRQTFQMNPGLPVHLHPVALGTETAELDMSVPPHNAGGGSLVGPDRLGARSVRVPVFPLSDFARTMDLDRLDVIKLDVEGFEAQVLLGAQSLLERLRPHTILLEENNLDAATGSSPAFDVLKRLDYDLYALPRRLLSVRLHPISEGLPAHDYVAIARDAPVRVCRRLGLGAAGWDTAGQPPPSTRS